MKRWTLLFIAFTFFCTSFAKAASLCEAKISKNGAEFPLLDFTLYSGDPSLSIALLPIETSQDTTDILEWEFSSEIKRPIVLECAYGNETLDKELSDKNVIVTQSETVEKTTIILSEKIMSCHAEIPKHRWPKSDFIQIINCQ